MYFIFNRRGIIISFLKCISYFTISSSKNTFDTNSNTTYSKSLPVYISMYLCMPFVQTTGENMIKFLVFHKGAILKFNSAFNSNSILLKLLFYSVLRFNMYPLLHFFIFFLIFHEYRLVTLLHAS